MASFDYGFELTCKGQENVIDDFRMSIAVAIADNYLECRLSDTPMHFYIEETNGKYYEPFLDIISEFEGKLDFFFELKEGSNSRDGKKECGYTIFEDGELTEEKYFSLGDNASTRKRLDEWLGNQKIEEFVPITNKPLIIWLHGNDEMMKAFENEVSKENKWGINLPKYYTEASDTEGKIIEPEKCDEGVMYIGSIKIKGKGTVDFSDLAVRFPEHLLMFFAIIDVDFDSEYAGDARYWKKFDYEVWTIGRNLDKGCYDIDEQELSDAIESCVSQYIIRM
jgi:hypothetical protein